MINYVKGNILESTDVAVVNPVNCVGIMGAGLAKQFRDKYPRMFDDYRKWCKSGEAEIGNLHIFRVSKYTIVNFPTKVHYADNSSLDYIFDGLQTLKIAISKHDIKSISIPALGCGFGNLFKEDVFGMIEEELGSLDRCEVNIYE
jgi:O-acetyl-ADP-ribose deacetylase (regulator of RNase III)